MPYLEECQKMANYSSVSLQLCELSEDFTIGALTVSTHSLGSLTTDTGRTINMYPIPVGATYKSGWMNSKSARKLVVTLKSSQIFEEINKTVKVLRNMTQSFLTLMFNFVESF